mgnify:CR=1 FL=1
MAVWRYSAMQLTYTIVSCRGDGIPFSSQIGRSSSGGKFQVLKPHTKSRMLDRVGNAWRKLHLLETLGRNGEVPNITKSENGHDTPAWHQRLDFLAPCQFHILLNNGSPRLPKPYLCAVQIQVTARYKYWVVKYKSLHGTSIGWFVVQSVVRRDMHIVTS